MLIKIPLVYQVAGLALLSYFIGSIPFGFLLGRFKGIDLRRQGSNNIGATNAGRVLGKKYFFLVLFLDAAKGFIPTLIAGQILFRANASRPLMNMLWLIVAFCAIAGHNWPCWLKFKGGKGVATSLGVVLAIYPYYTFPGLIAFGVWIVLVKLTSYVSLGSIAAAASFLFGYLFLLITQSTWTFADQWPLLLFASFMVSVLILRHWSNIRRLRTGTENKFSLE
ncbi:MAG: glycerol-3-phosphate 1-O-acyltransferase PlsY [Phycisphaerae bacterium]